MTKERFIDGDESTEGGLANGAAVVELGYPMKIEWVDVIIRAYPGDDNKKGYNVYLSNEKTVNTASALKIGEVKASPTYVGSETVRYTANTDTLYKYVLVKGYNSGECIAKEIKVMSSTPAPSPATEIKVTKANITTVMPEMVIPSFTAEPAVDAAMTFTSGDDVAPDLTSGPYMVAFGSTDYDVTIKPDVYGMAVLKDGSVSSYCEAKSISAGGKFGILIFGLDPAGEYTMKNAVKYNDGPWIIGQ